MVFDLKYMTDYSWKDIYTNTIYIALRYVFTTICVSIEIYIYIYMDKFPTILHGLKCVSIELHI